MDPVDELGEVIHTIQHLINYCSNTFSVEYKEAAQKMALQDVAPRICLAEVLA